MTIKPNPQIPPRNLAKERNGTCGQDGCVKLWKTIGAQDRRDFRATFRNFSVQLVEFEFGQVHGRHWGREGSGGSGRWQKGGRDVFLTAWSAKRGLWSFFWPFLFCFVSDVITKHLQLPLCLEHLGIHSLGLHPSGGSRSAESGARHCSDQP